MTFFQKVKGELQSINSRYRRQVNRKGFTHPLNDRHIQMSIVKHPNVGGGVRQ